MNVWIVQGDCGDYYCDGMHLIGVYSSEVLAAKAAESARFDTHVSRDGTELKTWADVHVEQLDLDAPPAGRG